MKCNLPFNPADDYSIPETVEGKILKALYGDSDKAVNTDGKDVADFVSEQSALLQAAANMLTNHLRPVCEFDMRYAMMWAYWKASEAFDESQTLENALILCSISVCETILKKSGYRFVMEESEHGD